MKKQKLLTVNLISLSAIILTAVLMRIVPHLPNFAPIGGLALFSGAKLTGKKAFIVPLLTMFISDLFLGFHSTVFFVYFSFLLIVFIGKFIAKKENVGIFVLSAFSSSILFFLITNFGVWFSGNMYAKNLNGLVNAYLMGVPFFRNTFFGDLFYTFSFFYGFRYLTVVVKKVNQAIST